MEGEKSNSEGIRKQGAQFYADAFVNTKLAPGLRVERAKKAIVLFMNARNAASKEGSGVDWVYATKNYGVTCWKLASVHSCQELLGEHAVFFYFREGISFMLEALLNGKRLSMPSEWYVKLEGSLLQVVDDLTTYVIVHFDDWRNRCSKISAFLSLTEHSNEVTAALHIKMAQEMVKQVVKLTDAELMNDAFSVLNEMFQPINFAKQHLNRLPTLFRPANLVEQIDDIEHSQRRYLCRVASAKERQLAETLQDDLLLENEELNMDLAMIVLDHFMGSFCLIILL